MRLEIKGAVSFSMLSAFSLVLTSWFDNFLSISVQV